MGKRAGGGEADTEVRVLWGAGASPASAPGPVRVAPRESEGAEKNGSHPQGKRKGRDEESEAPSQKRTRFVVCRCAHA